MRLALVLLVPAGFALCASGSAQVLERNPLRFHNSVDEFQPAPFPGPGGYAWKVFPRELLRHPSGVMHVTGIEFVVSDPEPSTSTQPFQVTLTRSKPSSIPGLLAPDFAATLQVTYYLHGVQLTPAPCPTPGTLPHAMFVSTLPGQQVTTVSANGTADLVVVVQQPFVSGVGPCGQPDHPSIYNYSIDENGADVLGNGLSPYGGRQIAGIGHVQDPLSHSLAVGLYFSEPTLAIRTSPLSYGEPRDLGLSGLNLPLAASAQSIAYTVRAEAPPGSLAFAASGTLAPLPGSGTHLFGAGLLLDPTDPALLATLRSGALVAPTVSGPVASQVFNSSIAIVVNAAAIGVTLHSQAFVLEPLPGIARSSNLVRTYLRP